MLRCSTTASRVMVSPSASMKMLRGSPATMWRSNTPFSSLSSLNPATTALYRARYLASSSAPDNSSSPSSSPSSLKWLDFEDGEAAFKNRTTSELVRAWAVFHVCAWTPVVRRARQLLALAEAVVGARAVTWVLRRTFFAHFCAGETQTELLPVIDRLRAAGVGAILDYAAEADLPPAPTTTNGNGAANAAKPQAQTQAQTADPFPYPSTPVSPSGPPPPAEFFRVLPCRRHLVCWFVVFLTHTRRHAAGQVVGQTGGRGVGAHVLLRGTAHRVLLLLHSSSSSSSSHNS